MGKNIKRRKERKKIGIYIKKWKKRRERDSQGERQRERRDVDIERKRMTARQKDREWREKLMEGERRVEN